MTWSTSDVAVCCSSDSVRSARALAQFVEQPRVLDGDDRLGGEGLDQLDLLLSKRSYVSAVQNQNADWSSLSKKGHAEDCAEAAALCQLTIGEFWVIKNIWNLDGFAIQQNSANNTAAPWRK